MPCSIKELSPTKLNPGFLHLKLFKDVANTDVDMLLPGATVGGRARMHVGGPSNVRARG